MIDHQALRWRVESWLSALFQLFLFCSGTFIIIIISIIISLLVQGMGVQAGKKPGWVLRKGSLCMLSVSFL